MNQQTQENPMESVILVPLNELHEDSKNARQGNGGAKGGGGGGGLATQGSAAIVQSTKKVSGALREVQVSPVPEL